MDMATPELLILDTSEPRRSTRKEKLKKAIFSEWQPVASAKHPLPDS
jgi:hypothetical protein